MKLTNLLLKCRTVYFRKACFKGNLMEVRSSRRESKRTADLLNNLLLG